MFNALIVEDDLNTGKLMKAVLKADGYNTFLAENGRAALEMLENTHIDIMIVDVMMPELDGYGLTKRLRENNVNIPMLMVSAKSHPEDRKKGFLVGIDDYMVKPVDEEEMLLRMKALLRRSQIISERKITFGSVLLDYDSLTVTACGESSVLPKKEFYLLYKLLSYPNMTFTRYQLMDEIWGMDSDSDERTVNVHINRLRERFCGCQDFEIVTVRGLGYKAVRGSNL